jgi:hypothetical protein
MTWALAREVAGDGVEDVPAQDAATAWIGYRFPSCSSAYPKVPGVLPLLQFDRVTASRLPFTEARQSGTGDDALLPFQIGQSL